MGLQLQLDFVVLEMNSYRETQVNRNHIGIYSPRTSVYSKDRHLLFVLTFSLLRSFASTPPKVFFFFLH